MRLFEGQTVLLVGLGESGLACARWIVQQGGSLTVIDTRENPPGLSALAGSDIQVLQNLPSGSPSFHQIVVSPGLAPSHPLMQEVQALAQAQGLSLDSELDLFADALLALKAQRGYSPKVVGITGTNGKTTTTRMVACLVHNAGLSVRAAGNISPAALDALRECLDINVLPQVWVLELSSFQLHWTKRLQCDASTVLNLTQDHLDWHASEQEYAEDKRRIFSENAACVLNRDDPVVASMALPAAAMSWSFGLGRPTSHREFGLVRDGGLQWLAHAVLVGDEASSTRRRKDHNPEAQTKLLMPTDALRVVGLHNAANAMAALALGCAIGLPIAKMLHGLRAYAGEPHRVEHVLTLDGVDYYDDSKGTNVGATVAALSGLQRPCILIAGGQGKGQDFSPLQQPVKQYCKALLVMGQDADQIANALTGCTEVIHVANMKDAVSKANQVASPGDCVLLSPACASLDMYKNYVARAEDFIAEVKELAQERGQVC